MYIQLVSMVTVVVPLLVLLESVATIGRHAPTHLLLARIISILLLLEYIHRMAQLVDDAPTPSAALVLY